MKAGFLGYNVDAYREFYKLPEDGICVRAGKMWKDVAVDGPRKIK